MYNFQLFMCFKLDIVKIKAEKSQQQIHAAPESNHIHDSHVHLFRIFQTHKLHPNTHSNRLSFIIIAIPSFGIFAVF